LSGYGKIVTVLIGIVAIAFAIPEAQFIFYFVLFAWSGLGAAFGPVLICLLYYKKTTRAGVLSGMIAGFLTSIVWVLELKEQTFGLYEAVPGFVVGIIVTMLVSLATYRPNSDNL